MISFFPVLSFSLSLAPCTCALPLADEKLDLNEKRAPQNVYPQGPSDAVVLDLPSATAVPPPTASGSLYGPEALLGYDGNPVSGSAVVEDYQLVPGQLEDPKEGLEVFFSCPIFLYPCCTPECEFGIFQSRFFFLYFDQVSGKDTYER